MLDMKTTTNSPTATRKPRPAKFNPALVPLRVSERKLLAAAYDRACAGHPKPDAKAQAEAALDAFDAQYPTIQGMR